MTADWLAAVLIAFAGIAGTVIAGWQSRKSQLDSLQLQRLQQRSDEERRERKLAYVSFLGLVGEAIEASQRHCAASAGSAPYQDSGMKLVELKRKCEVAVNEIFILADDPVAQSARLVLQTLDQHISEVFKAQNYERHYEDLRNRQYMLVATMREDLALKPSGKRWYTTIQPLLLKPPITEEQRQRLRNMATQTKSDAGKSETETD